MLGKWFPWRFLLRRIARARGFIDPIAVVSKLQRFAQPSEVTAPVELLRLGAVLQARGLINAQAIQHNLDWIWPYWVERQFDPNDLSFIPRAFSMTHINLTHRNWTAVGLPDEQEMPIVDPCGLVTPFYDGWSIDAWVIFNDGQHFIPSRRPLVSQELLHENRLAVRTQSQMSHGLMESVADVVAFNGIPFCRIRYQAFVNREGWLVISMRPYNPEGISFIYEMERLKERDGLKIERDAFVYYGTTPDEHSFSKYRDGDISRKSPGSDGLSKISCDVGLATSAAYYKLEPEKERSLEIYSPLRRIPEGKVPIKIENDQWINEWQLNGYGQCRLRVPDPKYRYLFDTAVKALILHSPGDEVYPGPFTYKHFWFRDAAFILNAMLSIGLVERAEKVLDSFPRRQRPTGYFHSQDGEWDSNGQALWILEKFCELTGRKPKPEWKNAVKRAGKWIKRKRVSEKLGKPHAGLFPAGFSAEHFGPSDFYFWDDFWGVAGLRSAAEMMTAYGDEKQGAEFEEEAANFLNSIRNCLAGVAETNGYEAMPASPYRRLDSGCVGSLVADYPLKLWDAGDSRVMATANYLYEHCFLQNGFFHDMSHSGINPYLTLHVAQVYLRARDPRFFEIVKAIASLASPTGQWPEAIHPQTKGGCMGDGQHIWAVAEWVMMIRSLFIQEEKGNLILFSGVPAEWLEAEEELSFGPALTRFGSVSVVLYFSREKIIAHWQGDWYQEEPKIEITVPGYKPYVSKAGQTSMEWYKRVV